MSSKTNIDEIIETMKGLKEIEDSVGLSKQVAIRRLLVPVRTALREAEKQINSIEFDKK